MELKTKYGNNSFVCIKKVLNLLLKLVKNNVAVVKVIIIITVLLLIKLIVVTLLGTLI